MAISETPASPVVRLPVKIAVLLMATIVGAGLCEVAARLVYPAPQGDREPRILFQTQPDMGFVHVPNQHAWMDEGFVNVNSLGLRGPEPAQPKPAGEVRVLAVGDSTTFGLGLNDDETYVSQLESRLRRTDPRATAINAGISGYNTVLETRLLQHFAPILRPDLVLVGVFWNDLPYEAATPDGAPLHVSETSPTAPAVRPPTTGPSASNDMPEPAFQPRTFRIGNPPSRMNRLLRSSRVLYLMRQQWLGWLTPDAEAKNTVDWEVALLEGRQTPTIDGAWRTLEGQLAEIGSLGKSAGFDVGIVIMPIRAQVEGNYPRAAYQSRLDAIARSLGLFVIDPLSRFREQANRTALFIPYDRMHYSAIGNGVLADAVVEGLRARPALVAGRAHD